MRKTRAPIPSPRVLFLSLALALGAGWLSGPMAARAAETALPAGVVAPKPIAQPKPKQPSGKEGEGWVLVRFSIFANGHTGDVRAVEAMPAGFATAAAVNAVKSWTYKPATRAGRPIDWFNNRAVVVFDNPSIGHQATKSFLSDYRSASYLVSKKKYADARTAIEKAIKQADNLYEIDLGQVQLFRALAGLGHYTEAYNAILPVTWPALDILSKAQMDVALQYRFAVEVELGLYPEALETFTRMDKISPVKGSSAFGEQADAVRKELAQGSALAIQGMIVNGVWTHAPARRRFTVANIQGRIDTIDVECNLRKGHMAFAPSKTWTLPPDWGDCMLDFRGENGTTFTVLEYTLSDAAGAPPPQ